ncbi:MAG: hypothetical protein P8J32_04830 [bacterium]|nr:hypothetical protein [bacterium]
MKTLIAQALRIPQNELDKTLEGGFYVKINKHYTATIRNLASFVDYLQGNPNEPDENFGIITKESIAENGQIEDSNFYAYLLEIIGYVNGFATFNSCPHKFVELQAQKETISIRTKGGKLITVAVIEDAGCVDVQLHNSGLEPVDNGRPVPQFEIIGFNCGGTPVPTTPVTLATIKLNSSQK